MIIACIADKPDLCDDLQTVLKASPDASEVFAFSRADELLDWVSGHHCDIVFLDIDRNVNGPELTERLREYVCDLPVVFCADGRDRAYDAFAVHADGYLLKPVSFEAVQREIDHVKGVGQRKIRLMVSHHNGRLILKDRNGHPLKFVRKKTLEFFGLLYEKRGAFMSTEDLSKTLWGDNENFAKKNKAYLWQLVHDMGNTLEPINAFNVLRRVDKGYALDMSLIVEEE